MTKLNVIGQFFGTSGYANHLRGLVNGLYNFTQDIHLDVPRPAGWELNINDAENVMFSKSHFNDGYTIMVAMPQFWAAGLVEKQKKFYGCCVWEGDKVPNYFINLLYKCDGVLVPSEHVKKAILKTVYENEGAQEMVGIQDILHVIPHGVDGDLFVPQPKPEVFTFVANKGWAQGLNDRGGVQWLLKAFCEEFKKGESVQLILKINPAYNQPNWNLHQEINNLQLPENHASFKVIVDAVDYKYMPQIYSGHCFVSPTMAEAFSIPCVEAMACELPVITTDFGGQTDYVTEETGWLVNSKPVEVIHDWSYEGINWHMPDIEDLKKKMRYAFEHPEECKTKGQKAREFILANYTWKHSAEKLLNIIKKDG